MPVPVRTHQTNGIQTVEEVPTWAEFKALKAELAALRSKVAHAEEES